MPILEGYILRRITFMFAAVLLGTVAVVWTAQVVAQVNVINDRGDSIAAFLYLSIFALPSVTNIVLPFAFAIAAAYVLNQMNQDSELPVINASGAPRMLVAKPIILLGIILSLVSFLLGSFLEPISSQKARLLIIEARNQLISKVIQPGAFKKIDDNLFIQIKEKKPGDAFEGIFLTDSRSEDADLIYYAKSGAMTEQDGRPVMVLADGEIHRRENNGAVSIIRFASYAFDLGEFTSAAENFTFVPRDQTTAYLLSPDANDPIFKRNPGLFASELHSRLSIWVYPLVLGLVAFAVAGDARSHRQARLNPVITVILISLAARWLSFALQNRAVAHMSVNPLQYAVPAALAIVAVVFITTNRELAPPARLITKAIDLFNRARTRIEALMARRYRRIARSGGSGT